MNAELTGKVALVTGASRGIGKAIAIKLASMGAQIAVNYLSNEVESAKVVQTIASAGGEAWAVKADVLIARQLKP